jgi:hypothetical protein
VFPPIPSELVLPLSGYLAKPGGRVHGGAVGVAVLEYQRPAVDADVGRWQAVGRRLRRTYDQ